MQEFLEWHANRKNYVVIKRMEMSGGNLNPRSNRQADAVMDRQLSNDDSRS